MTEITLEKEELDKFFLIIKKRKWKNGYLLQYCQAVEETHKINWQYTEFQDQNAFDSWVKK